MGNLVADSVHPLVESLTRREREVLVLLAEGCSAPEIAERLTIALSSAKTHIQHLYGKLGASTKRQAVARARALGLLPPAAAPIVAAPVAAMPPRARHNLPRQVTRFFGREAEVAQLTALIAERPLVTLTGAGGVGKTRLSLVVAEAVLDDFPDGVWLVELAAVANPALVPQQVAAALSIRDEPSRPILETLTDFLRGREALVVLDNCEHLLDACARLAEGLLRACPRLRILASSREPLAAYGEALFRVPSLPFPRAPEPLARLDQYQSVSLFIDRARLAQPDYVLAAHNAAAVTRICQRLDGIPLALEMAAARINLLSAEQVADRLDDAFHLLTVGGRTALPRYKTLRATIDWSHQLLNAAERLLLQRLAVFAGGCTLEAAEAVCSGHGLEEAQVLDVLGSLAAKSMLVVDRGLGQPVRYRLLETIRQYAWERLLETGEAEALRARHLDYFLRFAGNAAAQLKGPAQLVWLDRLAADLANLRAAIEHGQAGGERREEVQSVLVALYLFWAARGHSREAHDWLQAGLAGPGVAPGSLLWARSIFDAARFAYEPADRARARSDMEASIQIYRAAGPAGRRDLAHALVAFGYYVHERGDFTVVVELVEESIAICREIGDQWGLAMALAQLAPTRDPLVNYLPRASDGAPPPLPVVAPAARNDHTAERALFEESLALFHDLGDRLIHGELLQPYAYMLFCSGDRVAGQARMAESLAFNREFGNVGGIVVCLQFLGKDALADDDLDQATALAEECASLSRSFYQDHPVVVDWHLGEVARRRGDYPRAAGLFVDSLAKSRAWGNPDAMAAALDSQARIAWCEADYAQAHSLELRALTIRLESGHPICLAHSFHALALLAAFQQQPERAARLFGAAASYHPALYYFHIALPIWRAEYERGVAAVKVQLGEAALARLWAEGEAMTLAQAVAYAQGDDNAS